MLSGALAGILSEAQRNTAKPASAAGEVPPKDDRVTDVQNVCGLHCFVPSSGSLSIPLPKC